MAAYDRRSGAWTSCTVAAISMHHDARAGVVGHRATTHYMMAFVIVKKIPECEIIKLMIEK
jgi:hypothetical protein